MRQPRIGSFQIQTSETEQFYSRNMKKAFHDENGDTCISSCWMLASANEAR